MNKTPRLLQFWVLCLVAFASLAQGAVSEQADLQGMQEQKAEQPQVKKKVEVGVLAIRGHLYAEQRWQPTIDWLNQQISDVHFVLHPLNLDE
ncbi:sensor histidine kinase, partial [Vibrio alginolyticus]